VNAAPLGVIGLGHVGRALAHRARAAGMSVQGFDISADAVAAARAADLVVAPDLPSLLDASLVALVCVFDDGQLAEVVGRIADSPGFAVRRGLVVNAATCSPAAVEAAAALLQSRGIDLMELPLSGSSVQIRDGEALGLVGADDAVLARYADIVAVLSPQHFHVGPPGAAARAKLASNLVLGLNRAALAEGIVLAERLGLDGHRFLELLRRSPAYSRAVDTVGERMVSREFETRSRLVQHRKDLALILAQATGQGLPLAQAHLSLLDRAIALGLGEHDNAAVIAALTTERAAPSTRID
jgi:3-hydroxyisobutyrate dehydrogenase-like beta-hydroxyacid dehydrogenase